MTEFKAGDKVRVVNVAGIEFGELHYYDGLETEVTYTSCDGDVYLLNAEGEKGVYINRHEIANGVIELIEPKPTKKQRIAALEKTVASLTEQLQALQQQVNERFEPSTVVVEADGDTAALAKAIEETSVKTANELRAEVIEWAKEFVESSVERGRNIYALKGDVGNETYKEYFYAIEFFTKENKVTALVTRTNREGEKIKRHPDHVGRAKCMPGDVFNEHIGKAIALGRALGLDVSEFENAVHPTAAVGQIVSSLYEFNLEENGTIGTVERLTEDGFPYHNNGWSSHYKIINDTNAQYEVK